MRPWSGRASMTVEGRRRNWHSGCTSYSLVEAATSVAEFILAAGAHIVT
jgi:hypothetical protein